MGLQTAGTRTSSYTSPSGCTASCRSSHGMASSKPSSSTYGYSTRSDTIAAAFAVTCLFCHCWHTVMAQLHGNISALYTNVKLCPLMTTIIKLAACMGSPAWLRQFAFGSAFYIDCLQCGDFWRLLVCSLQAILPIIVVPGTTEILTCPIAGCVLVQLVMIQLKLYWTHSATSQT